MLKLTDLEFSETLELDKTSYLKGGSQLYIDDSEVNVSSDEIDIDINNIDWSTVDTSNDVDFPLYDYFYCDWSFYEDMAVEADIATVPTDIATVPTDIATVPKR